ncbi:MAG: hypothetical protein HKN32_00270 [Flavobacteriales bacterium]|nr:hypothetical protein [Flavobacteriales bacterium]
MAAIYLAVGNMIGRQHLVVPLIILSLIFGGISLVNGAYLFAQVKKRPQAFIRAFMATFTLRFLINIVILATYLYNYPIGRMLIVVVFFALFAVFTLVEKILIFRAFRETEID